jgi:hypothetical protein
MEFFYSFFELFIHAKKRMDPVRNEKFQVFCTAQTCKKTNFE